MYPPVWMLNESLVPDEPLMPSSMPVSHGNGPNQYMGWYQPGSVGITIPSTKRSPSASIGAGSDSSESVVSGVAPVAVAGGCQASDGPANISCEPLEGCAPTVAASSHSTVANIRQQF